MSTTPPPAPSFWATGSNAGHHVVSTANGGEFLDSFTQEMIGHGKAMHAPATRGGTIRPFTGVPQTGDLNPVISQGSDVLSAPTADGTQHAFTGISSTGNLNDVVSSAVKSDVPVTNH